MFPILFIELLKQSSYKTTILLSLIQKQATNIAKKHSKSNKITLTKYTSNKLSAKCTKDNIKAIKYAHKKNKHLTKRDNLVFKNAMNGNKKIIRHFLNREYSTKIINTTQRNGKMKLLSCASCYGHAAIVKLLIGRRANICVDNNHALEAAATDGHIDVVRLLLRHGANTKNNSLILSASVGNGHMDVVKILLDHGANVHANKDEAIKYAALNGHINIIKLLISKGANIETHKNTLFLLGVKQNKPNIVEFMLDNGVDIHHLNDIALHMSAHGMLLVIQNLIFLYICIYFYTYINYCINLLFFI